MSISQQKRAKQDKKASSVKHSQNHQARQDRRLNARILQRSIEDSTFASPKVILQLQRMYGNQAVSRVIAKADSSRGEGLSTNQVIQRDVDGLYGSFTDEEIEEQQRMVNEATGIDPEDASKFINDAETYMHVAKTTRHLHIVDH